MGCGCGSKKGAPAFPTKKVVNNTAQKNALKEVKIRNIRTRKIFA